MYTSSCGLKNSNMDFLSNKYFLIALTFIVFVGARILQRRTGIRLLNPILISMVALICFLCVSGIDYETYRESGEYIDFWLKPAEMAGCVAGIISVVAVAELLGASRDVILSLAPKAVTTPIAMEIASSMGGIPPLTAAVVVCTGLFGGLTGFQITRISRIKSPIAEGLSMGTAAHAIGTSVAMERSDRYGAFSSLGLTLNGLLTALLAPFILGLLGYGS